MSKSNPKANANRQAFLLTFFPDKTKTYEELPMNGFTLVKHIVNGDINHFEVAIFPPGVMPSHTKPQEPFIPEPWANINPDCTCKTWRRLENGASTRNNPDCPVHSLPLQSTLVKQEVD